MHETLQREIDHFIEHHVMSHGTSVFGMSIDSFMLILIPALLISLAFALRFRISRVPHGLLCAAEAYVVFIRDHEALRKEGRQVMAPKKGFANVQREIARKSGIPMERAGAILAAKTREASPAAKAKNPALKKVLMPKKSGK